MPTVPVYVKNWCYREIFEEASNLKVKPAQIIQKIVEDHYGQKRVHPEGKALRPGIRE